MKNTKKMVFLAILTALGVVLGVIDAQIGSFVTLVPFAKIGLANIVILLSILYFSFTDAFTMAILKSLLVGLILGSISTFLIGFTGTMFSFFSMWLLHKLGRESISLIGISVIGGVMHSVGQIIAVMTFYRSAAAIVFVPQFLVVSVATGIVIGLLTSQVRRYVDKTRVFNI